MTIVDRLREQAAADEKAGTLYSHELLKQAAYEIESLRKEAQILLDTVHKQFHQFSEVLAALQHEAEKVVALRRELAELKKDSQ